VIFGKSYADIQKQEQLKLKSMQNGVIWFAWYPVRENNGKWVWLQKVRVTWLIFESYGQLQLSRTYGRIFNLLLHGE
jgi:hypothetical protein